MGLAFAVFALLIACAGRREAASEVAVESEVASAAEPVLLTSEGTGRGGAGWSPDGAAAEAAVGVLQGVTGPVGGVVHCCPDVAAGVDCPDRPSREVALPWPGGEAEVLGGFADPGVSGVWHLRLGSGDWWTLVRRPGEPWRLVVRPLPHAGEEGPVVPTGEGVELGRPGLAHQEPVPVTGWSRADVSLARCLAEGAGVEGMDRFVAELGQGAAERDRLRRSWLVEPLP